MKTKEKIYIGIITILALILLITNVEVRKIEREPRTEEHIKDCKIYEICDYRDDWTCISIECPEVYDCWEEQRDCIEANQIWTNYNETFPPNRK